MSLNGHEGPYVSKIVITVSQALSQKVTSNYSTSPPQANDVILSRTSTVHSGARKGTLTRRRLVYTCWPGNAHFLRLLRRRKKDRRPIEAVAMEVVSIISSLGGRFFIYRLRQREYIPLICAETIVRLVMDAIKAKEADIKPASFAYLSSLYTAAEFSSEWTTGVQQEALPCAEYPEAFEAEEDMCPSEVPVELRRAKRESPKQDSKKEKKLDAPSGPLSKKLLRVAIQSAISHFEPKYFSQGQLPKGVTIRPSGKWQAQIYFVGQSRYLGVYENSREASIAFQIACRFLKHVRASTNAKDASAIFNYARKLAAEAAKAANVLPEQFQEHMDELKATMNALVE